MFLGNMLKHVYTLQYALHFHLPGPLFILLQIAIADSHRGSYFSMTGCLYSVPVLPLKCVVWDPRAPRVVEVLGWHLQIYNIY